MKEYIIEEVAMANLAGRIDTAIIRETSQMNKGFVGFWQNHPSIVAIFNIDSNDEMNDEDEYMAWLMRHEGEYTYMGENN